MSPHPPRTEVPPTAGLPPRWRDLLTAGHELAAPMADFLGLPGVQPTCSGTASLVIALRALHRLSGRRAVVVPAYTCPLVARAVAHCGLQLRLCDLAPDSIDFDPAGLQRLCDRDTLAVIPTHLGGRVADVDAVLACAHAVGAFVIEDAAQALGARIGTASVGLRGDAGFFSLAVGKGLTTWEGGLLVTPDAHLRAAFAATARELAPSRPGWELRRCAELIGYHALYRPALLGLAYGRPLRRALRRGDPVAAVGDDFGADIPLHTLGRWRQGVATRALRRLPAFLAACTEQAQARKTRLAAIAGIALIDDAAGTQGTWPFFMLRLRDRARRDAALAQLWGAGLGVSRLFIHALPDYGYLQPLLGEHVVPNARALAATMLTVSNSPWLDEARFARILAVLERVAAQPLRD
ncbi:DegT/DnrJ/EryC1/StrS family aminotransferase [Dokdonella sp.]|uniref:DegT/DnrJ/EryC1/StrS family aminotransferase n=1 Tax=Dokdonella sp. TaxID=2291710 RepID=UPI0025BB2EAB|nr:DegT/DnrJ/EryC1/StrS family aminotransferase [Dokdonella sp.]